MDFAEFSKLVYKQRLILLLVPLATVIITFFLVKNSPNVYVSSTQIATGITDKTVQVISVINEQESSVNQKFSNLMEIIQFPVIMNQVSYQLMLHDLTSSTPFKKPSGFLNNLNDAARKHAIEVYAYKFKKMEPLSLYNSDQKGLNDLLESMGYDAASLREKLTISRADYSDFVQIEFEGTDPQLTAFVVNTLSREFIAYNTLQLKENQFKAVNFLRDLLQEKRDAMNNNIDVLKQYKIKNRVLNLDEQAKSLYYQMADYETKRQEVEKSILSTQGALSSINAKFDPKDRQYLEGTLTKINLDINSTKERLQDLNDSYVQSGFNPAINRSIDSLKRVLTTQINESTDKYIFNPMAAKQSLIAQKLNLEIQLDLSKNSVASINNEFSRLNNKFDNLVPHEAVVQGYESNIDISSKEYLEILGKYNQVSMEAGYSINLKQMSPANPGTLQPSKKMLLVILSGIISFIFCLIVLFILFFLDDSIKYIQTLTEKTQLPSLGYLNFIPGSTLEFNKMWNSDDISPAEKKYKDLLRAIRFEIDRDNNHKKSLLAVTSLGENEGKTLFSLNLAYAYAKINKRVLLIDGNFIDSTISKSTHPKLFIEDYLQNGVSQSVLDGNERITIIGNRGEAVSLFEIANETQILDKISALKNSFDVILVDTADLSNLDKAKEWLLFSDNVVGIFEYGKTLNRSKKENVMYLQSLGNKFSGWVLNKAIIKTES